jgi:hypothetical protein
MRSSDITFRRANVADVIRFYGKLLPVRLSGYVAEANGSIVMIGGVYWHEGYPVIFSELAPEIRQCKKAIVKGVKLVSDFADTLGMPVLALPKDDEPTAWHLLHKIGFRSRGWTTSDGREYLVREAR